MSAALIKLIYSGYFIITFIFLVNIVSCNIYGQRKKLIWHIAIAVIWPLSLFSPKGRKVLFNQISKL